LQPYMQIAVGIVSREVEGANWLYRADDERDRACGVHFFADDDRIVSCSPAGNGGDAEPAEFVREGICAGWPLPELAFLCGGGQGCEQEGGQEHRKETRRPATESARARQHGRRHLSVPHPPSMTENHAGANPSNGIV